MCGALERKEIWFLKIKKKKEKKIIYEHDNATKNGQVHQWSVKIKIYMIYL